jgi:hypothetical protein
MRHFFTALLALLALVSCNTESSDIERPTKYQRITISLKQVRSGSLTKVTDAEVKSALGQVTITKPMSLRLTSKKDGTVYAVNLNEPVDIPVGEYTVFGEYAPPLIREAYAAFIYSEPCFYVEQDLTVTEDETQYLVDAIYLCIALVFDMTTTSKVEHRVELRSYEELQLEGDLPVVFARCTMLNASTTYHVKTYSSNPLFAEPTDFEIQWVENGNGLRVQDGCWYLLAPDAPTTVWGQIGVNFPEWQKG